MDLIIDANSVISTLIKEGKSSEILLSFNLTFYAPEYILEEIEEHKNEILDKTHRTESEFYDLFEEIKNIVDIIPKEDFKEHIEEAEKISQDPDDIMYFALALKLNCGIWSNDKLLKEQNRVKIYSTKDLIDLLG